MKNLLILTMAMVVILTISCAPMREKAFLKEGENNTRVFPQKMEATQEIAVATLAENGFQIDKISDQPRTVRAHKIIADGKKSCEISLYCYLFPNGDKTKVQIAAEEQISEVSYKVKTFWLIFIPIPYGREPKREVIKKGTITDPDFFKSFFDQLEKNLPTI